MKLKFFEIVKKDGEKICVPGYEFPSIPNVKRFYNVDAEGVREISEMTAVHEYGYYLYGEPGTCGYPVFGAVKGYKPEDVEDKLNFFCNSCGDLFLPGEVVKDIFDACELPNGQLKDLYFNHWTEEGVGCFYITEFCGIPSMVYEASWAYDRFEECVGMKRDENAEIFDAFCDEAMLNAVTEIQKRKEFADCSVIYGRDDDRIFGADILFALIVPYEKRHDLTKLTSEFDAITDDVFRTAFCKRSAVECNKTISADKEKVRRCPDCGFDKFETTMHATVKAVVSDDNVETDSVVDFSSVKSEDWICTRCGTVHKEDTLWTTKEDAENKFGYQIFECFDEEGVFLVYEGNKFIMKTTCSDESLIEKRLANLGYMFKDNKCGVRHIVPAAYDIECSIIKDGKKHSLIFQGVKNSEGIELHMMARSLIKSNNLILNDEYTFEKVIKYSGSDDVLERKTYKTYFNNGSIVFV